MGIFAYHSERNTPGFTNYANSENSPLWTNDYIFQEHKLKEKNLCKMTTDTTINIHQIGSN